MKKNTLLIIHIMTAITFVLLYNNKVEYKIIEKPNYMLLEPIEQKELDVNVIEKELLEELKIQQKIKAYNLVNKYIGKKGDCYQIAIKFVKELKGLDEITKYQIKESEAMAGDLIFYKNNGYGNTHWAVYLDEDIALHGAGQFDYKTYLRVVHEPNMSKPIFYRVEGKPNE